MLTAAAEAERVLLPLADAFFLELLAFGRFTPSPRTPLGDVELERALDKYRGRASTIQRYLSVVEHYGGLSFRDRLPFVMNTAEWDSLAPVAGYATGLHDPRPTHVATTLLGGWRTEAKDGYLAGPTSRLGRGALYTTAETSVAAALAFLVDLLAHGFCSREATAEVLARLIAARRAVAEDSDVVLRLLGGLAVPGTQEAWANAQINLLLAPLEPSNQWRPDITTMVTDALANVRRLRAAQCWDDWVVETFALSRRLSGVKYVREAFQGTWPITIATVLSQLEEIKADCTELEAYIGSGNLTSADYLRGRLVFRDILRGDIPGVSLFTEDVNVRLLKQRVLLPGLLDTANGEGFEASIAEASWRCVSWRLMHPLVALYQMADDPMYLSTEAPEQGELLTAPEVQRLAAQAGVSADEASQLAASGRDDVASLPAAAWNDAISRVTTTINATRLEQKLQRAAAQVRSDSRLDSAIAVCDEALLSFPWAAPLHQLRGLTYMRHNRLEEAIDAILPAVFLAPGTLEPWQALAVALNNSARTAESRLCLAIGTALASEAGSGY
jgi:hypothetical protein